MEEESESELAALVVAATSSSDDVVAGVGVAVVIGEVVVVGLVVDEVEVVDVDEVVVGTTGTARASFASAALDVVTSVGVTIEFSVTVVAIVARGSPSNPTVSVSQMTTYTLVSILPRPSSCGTYVGWFAFLKTCITFLNIVMMLMCAMMVIVTLVCRRS